MEEQERFIIVPSTTKGYWVATDTKYNIVVKFRKHNFNSTQRIITLGDEKFDSLNEALEYATHISELVDWLHENHPELVNKKSSRKKLP